MASGYKVQIHQEPGSTFLPDVRMLTLLCVPRLASFKWMKGLCFFTQGWSHSERGQCVILKYCFHPLDTWYFLISEKLCSCAHVCVCERNLKERQSDCASDLASCTSWRWAGTAGGRGWGGTTSYKSPGWPDPTVGRSEGMWRPARPPAGSPPPPQTAETTGTIQTLRAVSFLTQSMSRTELTIKKIGKRQPNPPPWQAWPLWWPSRWGTEEAPSWARWSPGPAWWTSRSPSPTCRSGSPTGGGCRCSRTACHRYTAHSSSFPWRQQWWRLLGQTRRCSAAAGSKSMVSPMEVFWNVNCHFKTLKKQRAIIT